MIIADDHQLYVDSLAIALEKQTQFPVKVVAKAMHGDDLLAQLESVDAEILLLDLNMPVMNGLDTIPILRDEYPDLRILVVTKYSDPKFVRECLQVNMISGYLLKTAPLSELINALEVIYAGNSYISKGLQIYPKEIPAEGEDAKFDEDFLARYNLTRREQEILGLIAHAKTNAEIADSLYISPQTVGAHRKNIMRKLNISTTASLVRFAIENQFG